MKSYGRSEIPMSIGSKFSLSQFTFQLHKYFTILASCEIVGRSITRFLDEMY